jgi:ribosomal-protein-serine acetyltransferase
MFLKIDKEISLKQLQKEDAQDIFNTINNQREYLGEWLPFVEFTKEVNDTQNFVDSIINAPEERFEYIFTIRKNDAFIGIIGFKDTDRTNRKTEIGYWISKDFQKQGIVTKAVQRLCELAFDDLNINRIQIKCAVKNHPSINIPKRLGFLLEGIERDGELLTGNVYTDLFIYSKLKND